jgi:hypothetical protein
MIWISVGPSCLVVYGGQQLTKCLPPVFLQKNKQSVSEACLTLTLSSSATGIAREILKGENTTCPLRMCNKIHSAETQLEVQSSRSAPFQLEFKRNLQQCYTLMETIQMELPCPCACAIGVHPAHAFIQRRTGPKEYYITHHRFWKCYINHPHF